MNQSKIDKANPFKFLMNWIATGAAVFSFGTVVLILLGYGVSLAVDLTFGLPHAAVFESTFDLVDLSSIAVLGLFSSMADWSFFSYLLAGFGVLLGFSILALLLGALVAWISWKTLHSRRLIAKPFVREGASIIAISLSIPLRVVIAFVIASTVLGVPPVLGAYVAKAHFEKWVIGPSKCWQSKDLQTMRDHPQTIPLRSANTERVANCVALKKGNALITRGRVVVQTSKAIVLVDDSGKARKFPTEDFVIEPVDSLPTN